MNKVIWAHADGRTVAVFADAVGTQAILRRAGFKPEAPTVAVETVAEPEKLELDIPVPALKALEAAGYRSADDLRAASDDELLALKGVGKKSLEAIRDQL